MLRKRFLFITLIFLLSLLVPVGWVAALPIIPSLLSLETNQPSFGFPCVGSRQSNSIPNTPNDLLPSNGQRDMIPLTGSATVGGFVWYDINGNGIQDQGEPGVDSVQCILCRFGENVPIAVSSTDTIGNYSFTITDTSQIAPSDSFYVVFQQPNGFTFAVGDVNGNDHNNADSDVITSDALGTGRTDYFSLTTSQTSSFRHAANTTVGLDAGLTLLPGYEHLLTPTPTTSAIPTTPATPTTRATPNITPTNTMIPSATPTFTVLPPVAITPIISATPTTNTMPPVNMTPTVTATPTTNTIRPINPTPTTAVMPRAIATSLANEPMSPNIPSNRLTSSNRLTMNNRDTSASSMCGAMDVVFVLDETGSMRDLLSGPILDASVINQINSASAGDYQLGLVTFKRNVQVDVDLATNTDTAVLTRIGSFTPFQGLGEPEASAEALNTVINGLDAGSTRPQQIGNFDGLWRPEAEKLIILVTDAPPGGFDDSYQVGVDDIHARLRALEATVKDIAISAIELDTDTTTQPIMSQYATETKGYYMQANNSQQVIQSMHTIINHCGGSISKLYLPFTSR